MPEVTVAKLGVVSDWPAAAAPLVWGGSPGVRYVVSVIVCRRDGSWGQPSRPKVWRGM
jgi:hypothetical protein